MHHDVAREQAVVRVDIDASHDDFLFFCNDVGDVAHNADVVVADDAKGGGILTAALAAPTSLHDAIAETLAQFGGVRAVGAMNLDAAGDGDEAEDGVAVDGVAALGQREVEPFQVLVYHQYVVVAAGYLFVGVLVFKFLCALCRFGSIQFLVVVANL